jgi:hypothetical protein
MAYGQTQEATMDTAVTEPRIDAKGAFDTNEGVFKVSAPRKNLAVVLRRTLRPLLPTA